MKLKWLIKNAVIADYGNATGIPDFWKFRKSKKL